MIHVEHVKPQVVTIPLTSAFLCSDCNSISNSSVLCPKCASNSLFPLATWLNRTVLKVQ